MHKKIFFLENFYHIFIDLIRLSRVRIKKDHRHQKKISLHAKPIYINSLPFIHVPKTGGSSLQLALGFNKYHHHSLRTIYLFHKKARNKSPLAFTREPFDRFKSAIYFLYSTDYYTNPSIMKFRKKYNFHSPENVARFIDNFNPKKIKYFNIYHLVFEKQVDLLCDYNGYIDTNNIYKISSLNNFMLQNKIDNLNVNNTDYKTITNTIIEDALNKSKNKILNIYKDDVLLFSKSKDL